MRSGGHRPFVQPERESAGEAFFIGGYMDRFWSKVDKNGEGGCWNFSVDCVARYGTVRTSSGIKKAHRLSWELTNGEIPVGLFVLHKCDNTKCVNPSHLFIGTQLDNILDMESKGRGRHLAGEQHGLSKLTSNIVSDIRNSTDSLSKLAKKYGVAKQTIHKVRHHLTWRLK